MSYCSGRIIKSIQKNMKNLCLTYYWKGGFVKINIKKLFWKITVIIGCIILTLFTAFQFALLVGKNKDKTINKYKKYYLLMIVWMDTTRKGFVLDEYLKKYGYHQIAIYGGGDIAKYLIRQLAGTEVVIQYVIDKTIFPNHVNMLPVYRPDDKLPPVDAIIVTPICEYLKIKEIISKQTRCPIISLEDIIAGGKQ